ncbi:MAG: 3-dehydroquinate synthase [Bacteroidetes bacterium RIFOXYA12_FULL_35_11]|nr:MAG: 3-dehydroquinate synthase [Bacteroidetes bacterium GWF2_35_48]OFY82460.1 MAG: 3-dehydroquinate synthase [Bacteroidetes bacterium RIFOXYA12_FULL_35_11]OFZ02686.1 MAG: 3-dehydroquinate synthase [Bacteroidetes bacterium RIFOXYC12_FULL_35_7]HBX51425.1 3-dehydroquinate synthase [Bacteroidales bacterium]
MNPKANHITLTETPGLKLVESINKKEYSSFFILTDENTSKHCLPLLVKYFNPLLKCNLIIQSGEENKNIHTIEMIWQFLHKQNADRKSLLINLGGGQLCDLGGFAAGTFKRGIDYINIPTTLLSMVDASSGGKTGFNFMEIKNEIGIFYQPHETIIYPEFLQTLDLKQIKSGFAEMLKHGLITDEKYWHILLNNVPKKQNSIDNFNALIQQSVIIKNRIVKKDPHENNLRKILNFGHTIGHAIESFLIGKKIPVLHGYAVAWGMIAEARLSFFKNNLSKEEFLSIQKNIVSIYGKPPVLKNDLKKLLQLMKNDKKNEAGIINFSLLEKIGSCHINCHCADTEIIKAMEILL